MQDGERESVIQTGEETETNEKRKGDEGDAEEQTNERKLRKIEENKANRKRSREGDDDDVDRMEADGVDTVFGFSVNEEIIMVGDEEEANSNAKWDEKEMQGVGEDIKIRIWRIHLGGHRRVQRF